ncbi:conjugal transfer protein TrbL family protein [Cytobacillus sp. FJAT-54145]|uniref:Conjugal transfer protein TrbL family protein n=1 Tax=Cytobacillus spartinae TaxID=3299023 RepID=A0ABW6KI23_9BACI
MVFIRKRGKMILTLLGFIFLINLLFFSPSTYAAGWLDSILDPVANFKKGLREWFSELTTSFATAAFEYMGEFIIAQTNLSKVPNLNTFVNWAQWAGGSLAIFFFIKRVVEGIKDNITGENEPNFAEMIGSLAISMALIFATPKIVYMFISINNQVVKSITDLGINVNLGGNEILDKYTANGDLALVQLHLLFMTLVWAISFLVFAIVGALRYIELAIVLIMGPIVSTTYVNRSGVLQTYWTEVVAIVFTQVAHVLLAYWIVQWSSAGTTWGLVSSIASAFISLRGPQILRQFIYSSGAGGAVSGASRFAVYKAMMPRMR